MNVTSLSRDQLIELKQSYICSYNEEHGRRTYMSMLCDADDLVSDKEIYEMYATTDFTEDDFSC